MKIIWGGRIRPQKGYIFHLYGGSEIKRKRGRQSPCQRVPRPLSKALCNQSGNIWINIVGASRREICKKCLRIKRMKE